MPKFRNYQTNFSGGLLSEGMLGRADLAQYENGCLQLENWWPKTTGGMRRRPGSHYLAIDEGAVRCESFIFSESQEYLFVFRVPQIGGPQTELHVYDPDTGALVSQVNIFVTWNETIIKEMSITQQGDVMFIAHALFSPIIIRRTGATTFVQQYFEFEGTGTLNAYPKKLPFFKFEDTNTTITVNGYQRNTSVTITASSAIFTERFLNRAIRYRGKQIYITVVNTPTPRTNVVGVILEDLDQGVVLTFNTSTTEPTDFEVGEIIVGRDSGVKAEVIETSPGSILCCLIAGKFSVSSTEDVEGLNSGNIGKITAVGYVNPPPVADWDEEAFSTYHGWPSVIAFHSQRLWLGGSSSLPAHIFGSRVAAFFNFDVGDALPADSIQAAIADDKVNLITDIVSSTHLQVFTDAREFYAPESDDRPLTPEFFDLKAQTRYGSKPFLPARVFDESTLFIQAKGNAIREFIWKDSQRGYSSDPISLIAEEYIVDVTEVEILYGGYGRPEQVAFFVMASGEIVWYHAARAEGIATWGRWTTQGSYKSLTVIGGKLFAIVERETDTGPAPFIERFELDLTMDSVSQLTDTSKSLWELPAGRRLDGMAVQATSGVVAHDTDFFIGDFTVANTDEVNLYPTKVDNVTIGLEFEQVLEIMPIEIKDQNGLTTGMAKRIVYADIYIASTLAVELEGNIVLTYLSQQDLTAKPEKITGSRRFYLLGYDERPTLVVRNRVPLPCEVLSLGAEVEY